MHSLQKIWLHFEIYGSQGTPRQIEHINDWATSTWQNRSIGMLLITTFLNFSDETGSEAHASAIANLSRGGKGELSTGTGMEHVDEHDGWSVEEEDDVEDYGQSGDVEGLDLSWLSLSALW